MYSSESPRISTTKRNPHKVRKCSTSVSKQKLLESVGMQKHFSMKPLFHTPELIDFKNVFEYRVYSSIKKYTWHWICFVDYYGDYMIWVDKATDNYPGVRSSAPIKRQINEIGWLNYMNMSSRRTHSSFRPYLRRLQQLDGWHGKMVTILQTIPWNAFTYKGRFESFFLFFGFMLCSSLAQATISHHWFGNSLDSINTKALGWQNV